MNGLPHIWLSTVNPSAGLSHNYNTAPRKSLSEHIQPADQQSGRKMERTRGGAKAKGGTRGSWTDPTAEGRLEKKGSQEQTLCLYSIIPGLLSGIPDVSSQIV